MKINCLTNYLSDEDVMHSKRVSLKAWNLSLKCGFSNVQSKRISRLGLYHDVGKYHIPDIILTKIGKLNNQEFNTIKKHTIFSRDILMENGFSLEEANIVLCHHENYDGTGYPNGLINEEIPIESQIISICDYVDARTSLRVYRKGILSKLEIINDLKKLTNKKFKKELVDIMITMINSDLEIDHSSRYNNLSSDEVL